MFKTVAIIYNMDIMVITMQIPSYLKITSYSTWNNKPCKHTLFTLVENMECKKMDGINYKKTVLMCSILKVHAKFMFL